MKGPRGRQLKISNETKDFVVRVINISIFGCAFFVALASHAEA
jgi:hypothetical protein